MFGGSKRRGKSLNPLKRSNYIQYYRKLQTGNHLKNRRGKKMTQPVLTEIKAATAIITLNRPEKRNAINHALLAGLYDAVEAAAQNPAIRCLIITGKGKSFCAGVDLSVISHDNLFDPRGDGKGLPEIFGACAKPIIGAVNGHAITGGFEIALNCDFLIASENASFADTHVKVGIHPGWGMTQLLPQAIGVRRAKQFSFTGAFIDARRALEWGLVNEVVAADDLLPRTLRIAEEIGAVNQDILGAMQALMAYRRTVSLETALAKEADDFRQFVADKLQAPL
jgi:enoyl-CoA hydratase